MPCSSASFALANSVSKRAPACPQCPVVKKVPRSPQKLAIFKSLYRSSIASSASSSQDEPTEVLFRSSGSYLLSVPNPDPKIILGSKIRTNIAAKSTRPTGPPRALASIATIFLVAADAAFPAAFAAFFPCFFTALLTCFFAKFFAALSACVSLLKRNSCHSPL